MLHVVPVHHIFYGVAPGNFLGHLANDSTIAVHSVDETTALGEPRPGPEGRRPMQQPGGIRAGTSLLGLVGVGAGVGLSFALIGRMLG